MALGHLEDSGGCLKERCHIGRTLGCPARLRQSAAANYKVTPSQRSIVDLTSLSSICQASTTPPNTLSQQHHAPICELQPLNPSPKLIISPDLPPDPPRGQPPPHTHNNNNPAPPTAPPTPPSTRRRRPSLRLAHRHRAGSPGCSHRQHRPWVARSPVRSSDTESATCSLVDEASRQLRCLLPRQSTPTRLGRLLETATFPPKVSFGIDLWVDVRWLIADFTKCLEATNGDMQSCGYYLEALKACQAAARQY